MQLEASDLEPYLTNVHDKALKHSLQYGVGFLHETMSAGEQEIVNRLFNNGAIQVRCPDTILPLVVLRVRTTWHGNVSLCCLPALLLWGSYLASCTVQYSQSCCVAGWSLINSGVVPGGQYSSSTLFSRLRVCHLAPGAGGHGAHMLGHGRGGLAGGHHGHAVL